MILNIVIWSINALLFIFILYLTFKPYKDNGRPHPRFKSKTFKRSGLIGESIEWHQK